jgi:acyl-CoA oxidase
MRKANVPYLTCGQIHSTGYIYRNFRSAIRELAAKEDASNGVADILNKICQLYGLWSIDE